MKTTPAAKRRVAEDELRAEYKFDYSKSRPNRFAARASKGSRMVVLAPDISKVFTTSESVNDVLRALIVTMPKRGQRTGTAQQREWD